MTLSDPRLRTTQIVERIHVRGPRKRASEASRGRLALTTLVFGGLFLVLGARLLNLTISGGEPVLTAAVAPIIHGRAQILDRNGEILATDLRTASVYADARTITDPVTTAAAIAKVLPGLDQAVLAEKLSSRRAFVWIARGLSPKQHYAVHNLGLAGIGFRDEPQRIYPNGMEAAHVVGYVDLDNRGIAGMERALEDKLHAQKEPVRLSLDLRVQHIVEEELLGAMSRFSATAASGVVLDVETGEILALASLPSFDPNKPGQASQDALFNRATLGVYELGSIFKVITTAHALDSGLVQISDSFDTAVPIHEAGFTINDFHGVKRSLSVPEIFMRSSNIGTVRMMMQAGEGTHRQLFDKLGLLKRLDGELPERGMPLSPSRWERITAMTTSYGHGIAVSPLHYAVAAASLVNGGHRVHPTFLPVSVDTRAVGERVISETTSEYMRALMRLVVTHGTGNNANVIGYDVGGKTGTAEKPGASGGYQHQALLSSFVAIFPANQPRYLIFVLVDEPHATKETYGFATAGWTAAPSAGRIIERIGPILGVTPARGPDPANEQSIIQYVSLQGAE